ncbi:hypothetical protein LSUE1_G003575 [Lachnellula suecica]|uniref:Celp0028 effector like protein n=1 Tax=Lachnellula suecica TaxID=602035 RepID=A0A8T9C4Z2_9HELO|nr:hypothetical protein LSUE1_G003575 [Lachnellula suecica]
MRSSTIIPIFLTIALVLPQSLKPRELTERDIIVIRDGKVSVMDKAIYHSENSHLALPADVNSTHTAAEIRALGENPKTAEFAKRGCKSQDIFTMAPNQVFLNWDVPMSTVVKAGETTSTVSVTEGYSISNSLSVASTVGATVSSFLTTSLTLTVSETWTSTYTAAYTFTVPAGKYGAVVSNPSTTRYTGTVDSGCIGASTREPFVFDGYASKAYGGLSWVDGTISLCTGDSYPLSMCIGDGTIS